MQKLRNWAYQKLRFSERFFKTDMVYLAKGGFWLSFGQVVAILSSIPLYIAFAHLMDQNDYGIYRYILSVASMVGIFSLTGLGIALARATARGFDGSLHQAFRASMRWSMLLVSAAFIGAAYYAYKGNIVLSIGMLIVGIFLPFLNSAGMFGPFLNGKKEFRVNTQSNNNRTIIHALVIIAGLLVFPHPLLIISLFFGIQTITAFYYYFKTKRLYKKNDLEDPDMESFAKHASFLNAVSIVADKIDSILLFQYIGAAQLAIYAFARVIPDTLNRFIKSIASLAIPKFAVRTDARGILNKTLLLNLVAVPVVALYIFLAPYIFALLFPSYMESVPFSQALAALLLFNGALPAAYIDAQAAIKDKYLSNIATGAVKITAIGVGVILFGIWGAVLGRFAGRIFGLALVFAIIRKRE